MTRPEEICAINEFISRHGVTRLDARYACESTQGCLSLAMAAQRLAGMKLTYPIDVAKMIHIWLTCSGRR